VLIGPRPEGAPEALEAEEAGESEEVPF